jgi:hypothetical protein
MPMDLHRDNPHALIVDRESSGERALSTWRGTAQVIKRVQVARRLERMSNWRTQFANARQ